LNRWSARGALVALGVAVLGSSAWATTITVPLRVGVTVPRTCTITTHDALPGSPARSSSSPFQSTCTDPLTKTNEVVTVTVPPADGRYFGDVAFYGVTLDF
jgi:hypothetical protein